MGRTKLVQVDPDSPDEFLLNEATLLLSQGEVIAFPTETVYGLGTGVFSEAGLNAIYAIKGRPENKPLPVMIADVEMLQEVVREIPQIAQLLMEKFWPGPLTLIFPAVPSLSRLIAGKKGTVAVRYPNHPVPHGLIRSVKQPLAATSANLSGHPAPVTAEQAYQELSGKIPLILDGGRCGCGRESTLVDCTGRQIKILREGAISVEKIKGALP